MSAKLYSCIWPQAVPVIFPLCSAASLTNIEKISLLLEVFENARGRRVLNRAGNCRKCVVGVRANETNSAHIYPQDCPRTVRVFRNIVCEGME